MKRSDFVRVNAATFYAGMKIEGEVYFQYDKNFILLCKDVTITPALLTKFYQTEWGHRDLFVQKKHVDAIMETSEQFKKLYDERGDEAPKIEHSEEEAKIIAKTMADLAAKINLNNDYQVLRNKLNTVMDTVRKEKRVPFEATEELQNDISTKIEMTDPALLIECINTLRPPDDYLSAHAANVGTLNGMIGTWLKMPQNDIDALIKTGLLHDLGKLRVPIEILDKPGKLTKEEFEEMKKHSVYSYEILKLSGETDEQVLEGVLSHHERLNGTGYPSGIQVSQISLYSRITAVSDVYDAMVAKRVYKDRHSPFAILSEFAFHKFSDLDIGIVNVFLDKMPSALLGKNVLLSDGRTARIAYINPLNFAYPIVEIDGELISTDSELECIAMENYLAVVED